MIQTFKTNRKMRPFKYQTRLLKLFKTPFFWFLTIMGNFLILLGSGLLYHFESTSPTRPIQYVDSLLWSTSLITTIGSTNYVPETIYGKLTVIILMLLGTLFVWTYMAFLVTALITPELANLEKDVLEIEKEILELRT